MTSKVYENDTYVIVPESFADGDIRQQGVVYKAAYMVINKETDVMEYASPQLPDAISSADQLNMLLKTRPWEWATADVNPDGSPVNDEEVH